jgi:hypothetical protein
MARAWRFPVAALPWHLRAPAVGPMEALHREAGTWATTTTPTPGRNRFSVAIPLLAALVLVNRRWIAGVGMLMSGLVVVAVHAAGYLDLKRDQTPTAQEAGAPGDTDS